MGLHPTRGQNKFYCVSCIKYNSVKKFPICCRYGAGFNARAVNRGVQHLEKVWAELLMQTNTCQDVCCRFFMSPVPIHNNIGLHRNRKWAPPWSKKPSQNSQNNLQRKLPLPDYCHGSQSTSWHWHLIRMCQTHQPTNTYHTKARPQHQFPQSTSQAQIPTYRTIQF